jgi:hypothetical protein
LAKFKKEKKIWLEFFNFLISHKCSNLLNKEIGVCIANNPKDLDFWRIAAYNEHENNLNTFVARNIFQKCIRMNKENINSYLDYFLFEIKFVEKILERKKILAKETEEKKGLIMIDNIKEEKNEENLLMKNKENDINIKENIESDAVLNLKICEVIWNKALNANLLGNFKENKILATFEFLRILYKNNYILGENMKNLKKKMIDYLLENEKELLKHYNIEKIDSQKALKMLYNDLFVLKIEKLFSLNKSKEANMINIANIKVIKY